MLSDTLTKNNREGIFYNSDTKVKVKVKLRFLAPSARIAEVAKH